MALTGRPVTESDSDRDGSKIQINDSPGLSFAQAKPALLQNGLKLLAQGPFPGRISMHGIEAMGNNRDNIPEAVPSKPRDIVTNTPVKIEGSKPTSKIEPRSIVAGLTRHDLQKWPCRRCHFVHRGGECEARCIGCGSKRHDKHDLACPFIDKVRQDELSPVLVRKETLSFREPPSQIKLGDPQISSTMQLSLECQRRGFNPEFKYYRGRDEGDNRADLLIKDVFISGRGISYKSQKDARDALAPKGLEVVRKMGYGPITAGLGAGKVMDKPIPRSTPIVGSKTMRSPPSVQRSASRSQNFSHHQPETRMTLRESENPVTDFLKSSQSVPHWRERPANTMAGSISTEPRLMGSFPNREVKAAVVVELPGDIDSRAARATVERAVAANPQTNISLHLPANVSVEVAQAYGMALSAMTTSSRRRSRSRSRSPLREVQRDQRECDRDRDRIYRDRERDLHPSRSSGWPQPQRTSIDAYRPLLQALPRHHIEDSRFRLSPPPEFKYCPTHERRDRYSRDGVYRH